MLVCMYDGGKLCVLVWGYVSRGQRLKVYLSIALRLIFKEDSFGYTDWPTSLEILLATASWYWDYRCEPLHARFLCRFWGLKSGVTLITDWLGYLCDSVLYFTSGPSHHCEFSEERLRLFSRKNIYWLESPEKEWRYLSKADCHVTLILDLFQNWIGKLY